MTGYWLCEEGLHALTEICYIAINTHNDSILIQCKL